jgi:hypothetical protein
MHENCKLQTLTCDLGQHEWSLVEAWHNADELHALLLLVAETHKEPALACKQVIAQDIGSRVQVVHGIATSDHNALRQWECMSGTHKLLTQPPACKSIVLKVCPVYSNLSLCHLCQQLADVSGAPGLLPLQQAICTAMCAGVLI